MQQYRQQERPGLKGRQVGKFMRRVLAIAVFGAIAAAVIYASVLPTVQKQAGGRRAKMGNGPVPVAAAQARIADVPLYLEGVGTAKARNTVTVRAQIDGRILSINFKEGQEVKRGDVLAKIDPATYQAQLDQAVAKKALDEVAARQRPAGHGALHQPRRQHHRAEDHRHAARPGRPAHRADQAR